MEGGSPPAQNGTFERESIDGALGNTCVTLPIFPVRVLDLVTGWKPVLHELRHFNLKD
ncbi:MAG: hypothetical protein ACOCQ6_01945 [Bacteroidota bacterium]